MNKITLSVLFVILLLIYSCDSAEDIQPVVSTESLFEELVNMARRTYPQFRKGS